MPVLAVLPFALIPFAAGVAGAIVVAFRPPGEGLRSGVQHFAAGVVFAAVAGELLPDIRHQSPLAVIVGFTLGTAVMLALRELNRSISQAKGSVGLIVAVGVDILIDGILLGIGFAAGQKQGILLAIALGVEALFVGLAAGAEFGQAGMPRGRSIVTVGLLEALLPVGATTLALLGAGLSPTVLAGLLAFGSAALLYLVIEELLVEAREMKETPGRAAMFFVGFLLLFVLDMIV